VIPLGSLPRKLACILVLLVIVFINHGQVGEVALSMEALAKETDLRSVMSKMVPSPPLGGRKLLTTHVLHPSQHFFPKEVMLESQ
jgi:hypothetical protein